jgi:hypothetical protein
MTAMGPPQSNTLNMEFIFSFQQIDTVHLTVVPNNAPARIIVLAHHTRNKVYVGLLVNREQGEIEGM